MSTSDDIPADPAEGLWEEEDKKNGTILVEIKRGPGGAPITVMTDVVRTRILRMVECGMWPERAARATGITPATLHSTIRRDGEFEQRLKTAEAKAERHIHGRILRHMEKQWTACAWMLERRWPERWAKKERPGGPPVAVQVNQIDGGPNSDSQVKVTVPQVPSEEAWDEYTETMMKLASKVGLTDGGGNGVAD